MVGEQRQQATFVSSTLVRCTAPTHADSNGGIGAVGELVHVWLSHTADSVRPVQSLKVLQIDSSISPVVSLISPGYGSVHEATAATLARSAACASLGG